MTKHKNGRNFSTKGRCAASRARAQHRVGAASVPSAEPPIISPPADARLPVPLVDDFIFELNTRRTRITDQMMLDQLREFGKTRDGRAFSHAEFKAWPGRRCSSPIIARRFGCWRKALEAAGIYGANTFLYEPIELVRRLEKAWRALGRRPGVNTLPVHGDGVTITPFRRHWGTFMRACQLFTQYKRGEITLEQLLRPSRTPARPPLRARLRYEVLNRDGHRCRSCGRSAEHRGVRLEVDHIRPVCAGGSDDPSNLRALCEECNRGKGGRIPARLPNKQ
jgi:hypothetical protein